MRYVQSLPSKLEIARRFFEMLKTASKSWYKTAQTGLHIDVLESHQDGEMVLSINGQRYSYRFPYPANFISDKLLYYKAKGWGKRVRDMIAGIDKFITARPSDWQS